MVHGDPQSAVVQEARGMAARPRVGIEDADGVKEDNVGWKAVFLGREGATDKDDLELEKIRQELSESEWIFSVASNACEILRIEADSFHSSIDNHNSRHS